MRLHDYIGEVIQVVEADAYDSDNIAASDNDAGVPIQGFEAVLFILSAGDVGAGASAIVQLQYSSTGNASDAVTSNAGMSCTDAVFATVDTDSPNEVFLLDFRIDQKGISDADGKLYAAVTMVKDVDLALVAIPYGGTRRWPSTNENTVVVADD